PNDGLTLTEVWGYAFGFPAEVGPQTNYIDNVVIYGDRGTARPQALFTESGYFLAEGQTATVGVVIDMPGDEPLTEDLTVTYASSDGTAVAGSDYLSSSGVLTFSAGDPSGTVMTFTVETLLDDEAEAGETIALSLESDGAVVGDSIHLVIGAHGLPYLDASLPVSERVADLLTRMSLEEKVGQITQANHQALADRQDIAAYYLGSLLSGGGGAPDTGNMPEDWADMVDGYQLVALQTRLGIPLIYGVDAVHGHNNVYGATIFPHNIGLGATRNPDLVRQVGEITAKEVYATGIPWNFAPCLAVVRDIRWGRTYEGFGETPELAQMMISYIDGLQGAELSAPNAVLATAKHWIGDGATSYGSSTTGSYILDQGITEMTEAELRAIEMPPYIDAISHGVGSVMPSYSSVDFLNGSGPLKMHAHSYLINDVLKGELGFNGFVISDWQAIDQIPGDYNSDVRTAINAGVDMVMVPNDYERFFNTLLAEVNAGNVSMDRIDDAVSLILTKKFELGLFEHPLSDRTEIGSIGSQAHRDVARQAVRESMVLLKNDNNLLPLDKGLNVYVAGKNANDIGNQSGGWTITWQGSSGDITPGTTILQGIEQIGGGSVTFSEDASAPLTGYDVGIVVVGETPYAEGVGDIGTSGRPDLLLDAADVHAIDTVCGAMPCVVVLVSGRPMIVTDQLPIIDSLVAAWLPGTEGDGVAEVLFGDYDFTGRLPFSWPRSMDQLPINVGDADYDPLFAYGFGLTGPRESKQWARDGLESLLPTGDRRTDLRFRWVIALVDKSLNPDLWLDGYTLDEKQGKWVFFFERMAASELMRISKKDASPADEVQTAIDLLMRADQGLAERAIDEAIALGGDADQISKAQDAMEKAAEDLALGKPDRAIDDYRKAWQYAVKSLELSRRGWKLIWSDEFGGTGPINRRNWNFHLGNGFNTGLSDFQGWGNNELEWYQEANAYRENGKLVIKGEYLDTPLNLFERDWHYTSARVTTQGLHAWQYGRIEARIAMPSVPGAWPAFWMLGDVYDGTYNGAEDGYDLMATNWSSCGEVDIMEHKNTEIVYGQNLFWDSRMGVLPWASDTNMNEPTTDTSVGDVTQFHVYGVEWDETRLRWYLDDRIIKSVDITAENQEEFHRPFFVVLNLALGGFFTGPTDPDPADFPLEMLVDYVRVYQQKSGGHGH
ncbi:MAG: glycoside hydrolase family 3 C-terminal domain-containing protein, partial [Anaerolineae bacterium]|nr:glycoside hydrolase family 3 C-terminal domain-containing protein [Anaerolineae bacterium]